MTQTVNKRAKLDLDSLTHKLSAYAIKNGIKRPNKGDVLSKLISHGVKDFDIPGYFNQA